MKSLTSNLTSNYLQASNMLQRKKCQTIVAYVESYDDIIFWKDILSDFATPEREFKVMLPSQTDLNRGKKTAMMNKLGPQLGNYMIACVDADIDYLMQGHTNNSVSMLSNPYVVHTYAYAIENLQCYAPSLQRVCVMATLNDRRIFDFEEYLSTYSEIIYDLFIWALWLYRNHRFTEFPLNTLNNFIGIEKVKLHKPQEAFDHLRRQVNRKVAWMQQHYPEAKGQLRPLKEELTTLGLRPDNTYMYIQGHHLMDNVVSAVLDPVCTILRRQREKEIKNLSNGHTKQMENELACYQHSQCPVDVMIRRNTEFKESEQYQQIKDHILRVLNKAKV